MRHERETWFLAHSRSSINIYKNVWFSSNHVSLSLPLLYILSAVWTHIKENFREKTPWRIDATVFASCSPWRCQLCICTQWCHGHQLTWSRALRDLIEGPLLIIVGISPIPGSIRAPLLGHSVTNLPAMWETWVQFLVGWSREKGMATHSSMLAWRISWTEEPDMGSQRVEHKWVTFTRFVTVWALCFSSVQIVCCFQKCIQPFFEACIYLGYHPTYNLCDVSYCLWNIILHARLYVLSAFCSLKLV